MDESMDFNNNIGNKEVTNSDIGENSNSSLIHTSTFVDLQLFIHGHGQMSNGCFQNVDILQQFDSLPGLASTYKDEGRSSMDSAAIPVGGNNMTFPTLGDNNKSEFLHFNSNLSKDCEDKQSLPQLNTDQVLASFNLEFGDKPVIPQVLKMKSLNNDSREFPSVGEESQNFSSVNGQFSEFPSKNPSEFPIVNRDYRKFPNINRDPRDFHSVSEHPREFPSGSRNSMEFPSVSEHPREFPNVSDHPREFPNVSQHPRKFPSVSENHREFPHVSEHPREFPSVSEHNREFPSGSRDSREIPIDILMNVNPDKEDGTRFSTDHNLTTWDDDFASKSKIFSNNPLPISTCFPNPSIFQQKTTNLKHGTCVNKWGLHMTHQKFLDNRNTSNTEYNSTNNNDVNANWILKPSTALSIDCVSSLPELNHNNISSNGLKHQVSEFNTDHIETIANSQSSTVLPRQAVNQNGLASNIEKRHTEIMTASEANRTRHQNLNSDNSKCLVCEYCGAKFRELCNLNVHRRVHTGDKPYCCKTCMKYFRTRSSLNEHLKTHIEQKKKFLCTICDKLLTSAPGLRKHVQCHYGVKNFRCEYCKKTFLTSSHLNRHVRIHTNEKPHKCDVCNVTFIQKSNMKSHYRMHKEKQFSCDHCHQTFRQKGSLQAHVQKCGVLLEEKKFKCDVCDKSFSTSSVLNRHVKIHARETSHKCDVCEKIFNKQSSLKRHSRMHEQKQFSCDRCLQSFRYKVGLQTHVRKCGVLLEEYKPEVSRLETTLHHSEISSTLS